MTFLCTPRALLVGRSQRVITEGVSTRSRVMKTTILVIDEDGSGGTDGTERGEATRLAQSTQWERPWGTCDDVCVGQVSGAGLSDW
eukprot:COSAG01_NODE_122_length_25212_cov_25.945646_15_plen_86_part_00